jgi:hypothetical protein
VGSNPTPAAVERVRLRHSGFGSEVDGNHVSVAMVVIISVSTALAAAAPPGWTAHGPEGGTVSAVELDPRRPSVVYAGTTGAGMFKSTNGGATWRRSSRGLPPDTLVLSLGSCLLIRRRSTSERPRPPSSTAAPTAGQVGRLLPASPPRSPISPSTRSSRRRSMGRS